jgi:hypothetical protein
MLISPPQDIEKLRKLVELEAAQPAPERGDAAVAIPREADAGFGGVEMHAAEFKNREELALVPYALLPEERGTRRGEPDAEGDEEHGHGARDKDGEREGDVKKALGARERP